MKVVFNLIDIVKIKIGINNTGIKIKKTAWADAKINQDFICVITFSGYSICQIDPLGKECYSDTNVSDGELGNMVRDALNSSRFVVPGYRKGVWVHPEALIDVDIYDPKKIEDRYQNWIKKVMDRYGYKTKSSMFKEMKNCSISQVDGIIKITPYRHIKLEVWGSDIGDGMEDVIICENSTSEEVGAGLRLAFSRCIA